MAWAFRIGKKGDGSGGEVEVPGHDYTSLLISRPRAFGFELGARSGEREGLVREGWRRVRVMRGEVGGGPENKGGDEGAEKNGGEEGREMRGQGIAVEGGEKIV